MDYLYLYLLIVLLIILEVFAMTTIEYSANNRNYYYIIGILLYMFIGFLLYKILINSNLAKTNAIWNVVSIILVTLISVLYFKEELTIYTKIGIFFAILSIIFLEFENLSLLFSKIFK